MVYHFGLPHNIYGVSRMIYDTVFPDRNTLKVYLNLCNFLLFLTGILCGCILTFLSDLSFTEAAVSSFSVISSHWYRSFWTSILSNGKFLLLLFLLSFLSSGVYLIPLLFGVEGAFCGAALTYVLSVGRSYSVFVFVLLFIHMFLILPYGFLLGTWASERCLSGFKINSRYSDCSVLLVTLFVIMVASMLERYLIPFIFRLYFY